MKTCYQIVLALFVSLTIASCASPDPKEEAANFIIENVLKEQDSLLFEKLMSPEFSLYETYMTEHFSLEERAYFRSQISADKEIELKPYLKSSGKFKKLRFVKTFDGIYDKEIHEISYPVFNEEKTKALIEIRATELKRPGDPEGPLLGSFILVVFELKDGKWIIVESDTIDIA